MGHREDLLEGAKKCLVEKGFVRTTARDIVKASGANLASIGYHYGSKDALLTQAFTELMEEWGEVFKTGVDGEGGSLERFRQVWDGVLSQHAAGAGPVWAASMEVALSGDRLPELRTLLAGSQGEGRRGLIAMFTGRPEEGITEREVRTLGAFYQALLNGLVIQWLFDPESAATAEELTDGMRQAAEAMTPATPS
ncbi:MULTISPECIES: TetR/AcrR family transcriptional regulator [Streptomyces]|uniref:TetR/AcrR family transcriptional regulator n=1 Tax=Streptomyces TaxID=1883 RepID=UPI00017EA3A5|nr:MULTISPECIES: TetR/AcrR family transcriptional regulator [Streptomyces]AKL68019.1 TetR family transcriptional regulator [Streptomyces sp. Mg1]EDX23090.1 TetR-family transcriptional regulator [Streptomyces sp. Mg1]OKI29646.1 TetR family transcriptional regulator [Streptomyces sp. CB03578]RPK45429.1 putative DNA-binding transcriptional regulator [Streptomyces sp. ADI91-18]WBY22253.1 TetR/AcrR family transcriptional regulator [Streptomyces goshikiensis]